MASVSRQQTFDRVARHLLRQGRPSVTAPLGEPRSPAYRGDDGCMCSAGCLIPNEMYSPEMEGRSVSDDQPAGEAIAALGHDLELVQQLQLLHDGMVDTWSPIGIRVGLRELAVGYGLDPSSATEPP